MAWMGRFDGGASGGKQRAWAFAGSVESTLGASQTGSKLCAWTLPCRSRTATPTRGTGASAKVSKCSASGVRESGDLPHPAFGPSTSGGQCGQPSQSGMWSCPTTTRTGPLFPNLTGPLARFRRVIRRHPPGSGPPGRPTGSGIERIFALPDMRGVWRTRGSRLTACAPREQGAAGRQRAASATSDGTFGVAGACKGIGGETLRVPCVGSERLCVSEWIFLSHSLFTTLCGLRTAENPIRLRARASLRRFGGKHGRDVDVSLSFQRTSSPGRVRGIRDAACAIVRQGVGIVGVTCPVPVLRHPGAARENAV